MITVQNVSTPLISRFIIGHNPGLNLYAIMTSFQTHVQPIAGLETSIPLNIIISWYRENYYINNNRACHIVDSFRYKFLCS